MEIADSEASGTGSRPVLLTPVGLRPPCVSKTDLQNLERFRLFLSLTSLTNEQKSFKAGKGVLYCNSINMDHPVRFLAKDRPVIYRNGKRTARLCRRAGVCLHDLLRAGAPDDRRREPCGNAPDAEA